MSKIVDGLKNLQTSTFARTATLSTLAATLAYGVGTIVPAVDPAVAAIIALVAVRPTLHSSIQESWRQIIGTVLGGLFGLVITSSMGLNPFSFAATLALSFIAGKLLKLGEEGSIVIGLTVAIVVATNFNLSTIEQRLFGVMVGSLLALVASYFIKPGRPHERALAESSRETKRASALLKEMSKYLAASEGKVDEHLAKVWLASAEHISLKLETIRKETEDALEGAKWSPLLKTEEVQKVLSQVHIYEDNALTLVNICKDIHLASRGMDEVFPKTMAINISEILASTADAISVQNNIAKFHPSTLLKKNDDVFISYREDKKRTANKLKHLPDTKPIIISGSILSDAEKIKDNLTE